MWKKLLLEADEEDDADVIGETTFKKSNAKVGTTTNSWSKRNEIKVVTSANWQSKTETNISSLGKYALDKSAPNSENSHRSWRSQTTLDKNNLEEEEEEEEDDDDFTRKIRKKAFQQSSKTNTPTKPIDRGLNFDKYRSKRKLEEDFSSESEDSIHGVHLLQNSSNYKLQSDLVTKRSSLTPAKVNPKSRRLREENEDEEEEFDDEEDIKIDLTLPEVDDDLVNDDEYGVKPMFGKASFRQIDAPIVLNASSIKPSSSSSSAAVTVDDRREINRYISRYLLNHQIEGIQWLWENFQKQHGVILGDDMGMGKTIQIIGLISAIFQKSGTKEDKKWIRIKQLQSAAPESTTEIVRDQQNLKYFTTSSSPLNLSFHVKENKVQLSSYGNRGSGAVPQLPSENSRYTPRQLEYISTPPVLIICPKSLVDNWKAEILRWGYFSVSVLSSNLKEEDMILIAENAEQKKIEVLLISYSQIDKFSHYLMKVRYSLIVYDEGHTLKNEKTKLYQHIMKIKYSQCRILLTGTPIQNDLKELWALLHVISSGKCIDKSLFTKEIEKPIKLGMSATATDAIVRRAAKAREELLKILDKCLLTRKKTILLEEKKVKKSKIAQKESIKAVQVESPSPKNGKDSSRDRTPQKKTHDEGKADEIDEDNNSLLKGKEEVIVLCDLSSLQQQMYQICLAAPDFENVRYHARRCPCGSKTQRSQCCIQYQVPYHRDQFAEKIKYVTQAQALQIDPRAALWRQFHNHDQPCSGGGSKVVVDGMGNLGKGGKGCPLCVLLPCLNKLNKIACHPILLQSDPKTMTPEKTKHSEDFLRNVFPSHIIEKLGGLQRSYRFLEMKQSTELSGKMKTLREMLSYFIQREDKTLVFSLSTQVLDLIEILVISEGWKCLRLDGQTAVKKRQQLVDQFNQQGPNAHPSSTSSSSKQQQNNSEGTIFIFLISSRAGGLGLNLNTASKVIIFDVDWNPVVDMQSQDRAYRIGQREHVTVYRLVSKGTVEELAYMRQLYKQQLQNSVLAPTNDHPNSFTDHRGTPSKGTKKFKRGKFEGVEGDSSMKGDLFGIENLFQFSENSILHELRAKYSLLDTHSHNSGERKKIDSKNEKKRNKAAIQAEEIVKADIDQPIMIEEELVEEVEQEEEEEVDLVLPNSSSFHRGNFIRRNEMSSLLDRLLKEEEDDLTEALSNAIKKTETDGGKLLKKKTIMPPNPQGDGNQQTSSTEILPFNENSETVAMSILKNIGVNLENAHRIDEILNDTEDTPENSQMLISPALSLSRSDKNKRNFEMDDFFEMKTKPIAPTATSETTSRSKEERSSRLTSSKTTSTSNFSKLRNEKQQKVDVIDEIIDFSDSDSPAKQGKSQSKRRNKIEEDYDDILNVSISPQSAETKPAKRKLPFSSSANDKSVKEGASKKIARASNTEGNTSTSRTLSTLPPFIKSTNQTQNKEGGGGGGKLLYKPNYH